MRPESTVERFIITTTETHQVVREETSTIIPKDQIISYEDLRPDVSITWDAKGNIILKETKYKSIKLQWLVGEEDAGSKKEDLGQSGEGERVSRRRRGPEWGPVHSWLGLRWADQWEERGSEPYEDDMDQDEDEP